MNYVILNDINSNTIQGLLIQSLPPISKPLMRTQREEIDGRDGDIVTKLGYSAYDKEMSIGLYGDFDINEVIAFFASEGVVTFSNEPDKYYYYSILEQIDYERLIRFKTATVTFHCQPFKYKLNEEDISIEAEDYEGDIVELDNGGYISELVADINPIQDLNGYANPWPAGGGKNKLSSEWQSGSYGANGNKINDDTKIRTASAVNVSANTTYTLSFAVARSGGGLVCYYTDDAFISRASIAAVNPTFTTPATCTRVTFAVPVESDGTTPKAQLELGSSPTDWSPYSNICPISGRTEVNVTRAGRNLFPVATATSSGAQNIFNNYALSLPSATYTLSFKTIATRTKTMSLSFGLSDGTSVEISLASSTNKTTFTASASITKLTWYVREASNVYDIQLESGSTDHAYEPYLGQTYPFSLGQTVYGGTLSPITGVLTIDRKEFDLGSLGWAKSSTVTNGFVATSGLPDWFKQAANNTTVIPAISDTYTASSYNNWLYGVSGRMSYREAASGKGITICDASLASYYQNFDAAAFALAVAGKKIVYTLATPITVQLTPQEVVTLLGEKNYIWADSGDIALTNTDGSVVVTNEGNTTAKPKITLTGKGNINLRLNETEVLSIALGNEEFITIDAAQMEAYKNGVLKNRLVSGSYDKLVLNSGENEISWAGGVTNVVIENYTRWI